MLATGVFICYNILVALPENPFLPQERTSDYAEFTCNLAFSQTELSSELKVVISLTFGQKDTNEFTGRTYAFDNDDKNTLQATSFFEAAQKVWDRYKRTEDKYRIFVKKNLEDKWQEFNGEELTSKVLELN